MPSITEGAELRGESGKTYLAVSPLGQANVWTAVDKHNPSNIVVLKSPGADDTFRTTWTKFQHEMIMHELFKNCSSIRKQVDRIPPVKGSTSPPILVLEIFETTLWGARTKRPFTKPEVRTVGKAIVQGLADVHSKGLVYADLKMQNVMINGFDTAKPGDINKLVAKLGDLGIVMEPSIGIVQPVAYRAPEVFFKRNITQAADIWSFGLIYSHLLEARHRMDKSGLYDDLAVGNGSIPEREQALKNAMTNDYDLQSEIYYRGSMLPERDTGHETGRHWEELRKRGLGERDLNFLKWVLKADPTERPTAKAILESKWLDSDDSEMNFVPTAPNSASQPYRSPYVIGGGGYKSRPTSSRTATAPPTSPTSPKSTWRPSTGRTPTSLPTYSAQRQPNSATYTSPTKAQPTPQQQQQQQAPMSSTQNIYNGNNGNHHNHNNNHNNDHNHNLNINTEVPFTPSGNGAFETLLGMRQAESTSPVKQHPIFAAAMAQAQGGAASKTAANLSLPGGDAPTSRSAQDFVPPGDSTPARMDGAGSEGTGEPAAKRPAFMGKNSSRGGTYLSYQ